MNVSRHEDIEKDLRNLRRFTAPLDSLEAWERIFSLKGLRETPGIDQFPGFGERKIYKARVVPLRENAGKLKGYRVVFQVVAGENCRILVFSRYGIYRSEQELMSMVKQRMD